MHRSLDWDDGAIKLVDQTALPHEFRMMRVTSVDDVIGAIRNLVVRGAPAIGIAGALGVALSARAHTDGAVTDEVSVLMDAKRLATARPTAVNLATGVQRALSRLAEGPDAVVAEGLAMLEEDELINQAAAQRAADLILLLTNRRPLRISTHCNTGRLATAAWGTALGAVRYLAATGEIEEVLIGETRPLLQGARLTVWELMESNIPCRLCVDSAMPAAIASGRVDCVVVGADRVAANGDVANKIGTYSLAIAAARHGIPFVVVAPESTIDASLPDGRGIIIEQRPAEEVTHHAGRLVTSPGVEVYNPAFDVTPVELVTSVVTEQRVYIGPQRCKLDVRTARIAEFGT